MCVGDDFVYICSELGKGATSETGKFLFRAVNVCAVSCCCLLWLGA